MSKIFISYRREDSAPYAGRLYDRLKTEFTDDRLFMDIDHIEPGEDFVDVINARIAESRVLVVLIGRNWLTCTDSDGARRLDNPEDFVRLELTAALRNSAVRVIPVLVGGAHVPAQQQLPPDIASLARRNALELTDQRFHQDAGRLIEVLRRIVTIPEPQETLSTGQSTPATEDDTPASAMVHSAEPAPVSNEGADVGPEPPGDTKETDGAATGSLEVEQDVRSQVRRRQKNRVHVPQESPDISEEAPPGVDPVWYRTLHPLLRQAVLRDRFRTIDLQRASSDREGLDEQTGDAAVDEEISDDEVREDSTNWLAFLVLSLIFMALVGVVAYVLGGLGRAP